MNRLLTTIELKKYIYDIIENTFSKKQFTKIDINVNFTVGTANSIEGTYVYSDDKGYHYLFTEKGKIRFHKISQKITDITYWILEDVVFNIALKYATENQEKGVDFRKKLFEKELEIWCLFGKDYYAMKKRDIENTLKDNPYVDV